MKFSLFKQKDFALLMLGKLVSLIGSEMQSFALSLYVLQITGSAAQFAGVLSVAIIPRILLGPFVGVFVDWLDRKKIIVFLDMFNGILIGIYAFMFFINGEISITSIYVLTLILSFVSIIFQPAISTVVPTIVKKDDLVNANSMNMLILNIGALFSPAIAGALYGFWGMQMILIVNAVSFIFSSISEMFIRIPKVNAKPEKMNVASFKHDLVDGLKFIKNNKLILAVTINECASNFAYAPIGSLGLVFIAKQILQVSDSQYGIMQTIIGLTMIVGPFVITAIRRKYSLGKIIYRVSVLIGIMTLIVAIIPTNIFINSFSSNVIPAISLTAIMFIIGVILSIGSIAMNTIYHQEVPIKMMGRVNTAATSFEMAAAPFGQMLFGVLFDVISPWICFVIAGLIFIVSAISVRNMLLSNEQGSNSAGKLEVSIDSNES